MPAPVNFSPTRLAKSPSCRASLMQVLTTSLLAPKLRRVPPAGRGDAARFRFGLYQGNFGLNVIDMLHLMVGPHTKPQ
jgi:hypothetical protein